MYVAATHSDSVSLTTYTAAATKVESKAKGMYTMCTVSDSY
jgi:hypothetical protein